MINKIPNNDIDSADEVTQGMNGIRVPSISTNQTITSNI
jgi:hypothetical protein